MTEERGERKEERGKRREERGERREERGKRRENNTGKKLDVLERGTKVSYS